MAIEGIKTQQVLRHKEGIRITSTVVGSSITVGDFLDRESRAKEEFLWRTRRAGIDKIGGRIDSDW